MNWPVWAHIAAGFCLGARLSSAEPLVWSQGKGFRSAEVRPVPGGRPGFTLMPPERTGITFANELRGDAYLTNSVAHNGSGLALGDVDGDGWVDIYLCNLQGPNRLYRNLGNWRFEEMEIGPAACAGQFSTGAAFADVDGDGDLDLLVNGIAAGTRLFLNDGKGHWTEKLDSGLSRTNSATSLALADIDGDGDLDLYCTHYIDVMYLFDPTTRFALARRGNQWMVTKVNGQPATLPKWTNRFEALPDGRVRELPEAHAIYRNDGHGHFTAIQNSGTFSDEQGKPIAAYRDWGLSVMFRDLNGDGAPDIYVCNDNASPDRIWINTGHGTFRPASREMFRHFSRSAMGIDIADVNRDGYDDIIVLDMLAREHGQRMKQLVKDYPDRALKEHIDERPEYNRNSLFLGRPDGTYAETALMAGLAATDWSWCPIFVDVDLDGFEDLLVTNGFEFDVLDQDSHDELHHPKERLSDAQLHRFFQFYPHWRTQNAAFRNRGDGTFEPMNDKWGFDKSGVSYGMALADLDNDGDLDVVVNNLNDTASIYRNDTTGGRVQVRLKGSGSNTQGIGARIRLTGGAVTQSQEMICGGRYLSGDQAVRVFAANSTSPASLRLEVKWRNGKQSLITNVQPNRIYEIDEAGAAPSSGSNPPTPAQHYFKDASAMLGHVHTEVDFDDALRQPLLPRRLSRLGPGVSWYDLDGDGWDDLIVTSGRGGSLAVFMNQKGQSFRPVEKIPTVSADGGAVVGWPDGNGNREILVAISNYEMPLGTQSEIMVYSPTNYLAATRLPAGDTSLGPMALADIDGDGDLDLFVGGRFRPGHYPESCSSKVWLNDHGQLRPSDGLSKSFETLGLVSGALFADLDGDGQPDLALAMEWGPVRVFRNNHGSFEEVTGQWGLADTTGGWSGIAAGDFDGDGRIDLVVGNWGRNTECELFQTARGTPRLRIYYDDANGDGILELCEAYQSGDAWLPIRDRTHLAFAFPDLSRRFATHKAFASATVPDIFGARFKNARFAEATHFDSTIFLNRGSRFEARPLPREAQLAPVMSVNVGDFDGDGIEDLFLSQNLFGSISDINRDDSGRGLWLRGRGEGSFDAVEANTTGIKIYGEQRGAALADFNHDGRIDLVVSQNSAATKLYLNERAKPGLRVKLNGPPGNPDAIGAQLRVIYADERKGPCHVVQAGSGYWSQDSAVQVLGLAETPVALWIRSPAGHEQTLPLGREERVVSVELK